MTREPRLDPLAREQAVVERESEEPGDVGRERRQAIQSGGRAASTNQTRKRRRSPQAIRRTGRRPIQTNARSRRLVELADGLLGGTAELTDSIGHICVTPVSRASSSPGSASCRRSASAASASGSTSAAAAAARARSPSSTRRSSACRVAAPVSGVTIDDVPALDGDDIWDAGYRADPKRYSRAALDRRHRRARGVGRRRAAHRRAGRGRRDRQRRRRHRRRRAAVLRLLRRARPQGHAVRDSGLDRRHGVERDLDLAAAARHQPRAVVRLHELDRRDRLRGGADSVRRGRRAPVGRRRRVRDAGHDVRLLADARRVDGVQRSPGARRRGRSTAAATASCSARARGWWCSSARIARARAARTIYASIDGYGSTCDAYHRVQMAPDGEEIVRAIALAIERSGRAPRGDRLRQLPRHVDGAQRRRRVAMRARRCSAATPIGSPGSSVKSMIGHPQGASGAAGHRHRGARDVARLPAADHQPDRSRSGVRSRLHPEPAAAPARVEAALCNCLGFGSKNSALVIGRVECELKFSDCQIVRLNIRIEAVIRC